DIDQVAVAHLRAEHPHWRVGRCDFLHPCSVAHSPLTRVGALQLDAVVLNPPFSCRGSYRVLNSVNGANVTSSVAMGFVLRAFQRLGLKGQMAALLPAGCLRGEKDEDAWRLLSRHGAIITLVKEFGRGNFDGAFALTVLVHLRRQRPSAGSGYEKSSTE